MQTQNINANTKYKYTPKTNANRKQIHTERLMQTQKQMHTENTDANMKLQMQTVNAKLESHLRLARVRLWAALLYSSSLAAFLPVPILKLRLIFSCSHTHHIIKFWAPFDNPRG